MPSTIKPVWQRFLIVLAGPVANFLLAIAIFAAFFAAFGMPRTPPVVVGRSQPGSAAAADGLAAGRPDRQRSPARRSTASRIMRRIVVAFARTSGSTIVFERGGQQRATAGDARVAARSTDEFGQKFRIGLLGVSAGRARAASGCRSLEIDSGGDRATPSTSTRSMIDGLWPDHHRPALDQGSRRAAQDGADRRTAGEPRLRSSSSSCSRCSQLISDSSTSCQSRCSMADIWFSTRSRRSGGGRSANGRRIGRFGRACAASRAAAVHHSQRLGLFRPVRPTWALDWIERLGQG